MTLEPAALRPGLLVYAFEPDLAQAARIMGRLRNYVVVPFAVAETDGQAEFHLNDLSAASSLLPLDPEGVRRWAGGEELVEVGVTSVPTIRLDTFMAAAGIGTVAFLKVDAQGADLSVLRSAGERIRDVARITVEAPVTDFQLYRGSATKEGIVAYLEAQGFRLEAAERQSRGQEENLTFVRL